MPFLWRRRRGKSSSRDRKNKFSNNATNSRTDFTIPSHFRCPMSLDLMKDPVSLTTGITYDRENIEKWIDSGKSTCPMTNQVLTSFDLIPNHVLRKMIQEWCVTNKSHGVERIQTPKTPLTAYDVPKICSRISSAARIKDEKACSELILKVKTLAKESERNKRCLAENGIGSKLAEMFEAFADFPEINAALLEEILSALTWCFPIGEEGVSKLKSPVSQRALSACLKSGDDSLRQNTIYVLKELVCEERNSTDGLMEIEGTLEMLVKTVEEPVSNKTTRACLAIIHHLMSGSSSIASRFVELGLVPLVLEMLIDGNRRTCDSALAVLDCVCDSREGREIAYENALFIPLLVKTILRVSDASTQYSVSTLWKLIKLGENEEALIAALQLGAFQKLLLVLQVGCDEATKEKVTEMLKMMNLYKDKIDCFDSSMGFKYLERSY